MVAPVLKEAILERFFSEIGEALVAYDLKTQKILQANPAFEFFTGLQKDEYTGEGIEVIAQIPTSTDLSREIHLRHDLLAQPGIYNDVVLPHKVGTYRFVTVKIVHTTIAPDSQFALVLISDDTQRQFLIRDLMTKHQSLESSHTELESAHQKLKISGEKIMHASKMAALGELATGLSHELNQPLTGIRGFAQEISDILGKDKKPNIGLVQKLALEVVQNVDKMAQLLSQFRSFARESRKGQSDFDPVAGIHPSAKNTNFEITTTIEKTLRLFAHQFESRKIHLELHLNTKVKALSQNQQGFEQILINLLSNARDSFDSGEGSARKKKIAIFVDDSKAEPQQCEIRVTDNGSGISTETKQRIFDPFFTTKDVGKGTGLGLSISYSLAHKLGGDLVLEHSEKSKGSTFLWTIPVDGAKRVQAPESQNTIEPLFAWAKKSGSDSL